MDPVKIAALLQDYGPWAVVGLFAIAIVGLWLELKAERKRRDADARGYNLHIIQMVKESAEREKNFTAVIRLFSPKGG